MNSSGVPTHVTILYAATLPMADSATAATVTATADLVFLVGEPFAGLPDGPASGRESAKHLTSSSGDQPSSYAPPGGMLRKCRIVAAAPRTP